MVMPASETLCQLAPRQPLPAPQGRHLWRVRRGVLRMDSLAPGPDAGRFVRMALPGDVLGVEHWAGMQESCQVFALTSAELVPLVPTAAQAIDLLVDTVVLAHQRASEALTLRSGPVAKRVQRLLLLLAQSEGRTDADTRALALPHLVDMSEILDAAPETVSRVFSSLRGLECVQERTRQRARLDVSALRGLQSMVGLSAPGPRRSDRDADGLVASGP